MLAASLLTLGMASPTTANAIQTRWNNFLAGGQTEWKSTPAPPVTLQIKREIAQALSAPTASTFNTLFVQYLQWRRGLNPTRFDRWHPIEGPIVSHIPPPTINPQPQILPPPPPVPEPGTMTVALALLGAGFWWRRRSLRVPAA